MADTRKKVVNAIKEDGKHENTDGDLYLPFVLAIHRALARLVPGTSQNQAVSAGLLLATHWHMKNYWGTFYIFHHCLMKARCNYLPFVFTTALEISLKK